MQKFSRWRQGVYDSVKKKKIATTRTFPRNTVSVFLYIGYNLMQEENRKTAISSPTHFTIAQSLALSHQSFRKKNMFTLRIIELIKHILTSRYICPGCSLIISLLTVKLSKYVCKCCSMATVVVNCHWCHTEFMEMLVKMQSHPQLFRKVISEDFVWVSVNLFLANRELDMRSNVW